MTERPYATLSVIMVANNYTKWTWQIRCTAPENSEDLAIIATILGAAHYNSRSAATEAGTIWMIQNLNDRWIKVDIYGNRLQLLLF